MLMVISPAKTLDYETPWKLKGTQPQYLDDSEVLIEQLRKLSPQAIASLMSVSDKIAGLNAARFAEWQRPFDKTNAKPAILAFKGDVYTGLDAQSLSAAELDYAQKHLRILSGLYGLLRPKDLMQPYRLEMGTKFNNHAGKDLYSFWEERLVNDINKITSKDDEVLVNLASNEYFKALPKKSISARVITPVFKDWKNGQYKIISFYAKKARGLMASWVIREGIESAEALKEFSVAGYQFNKSMSKENEWVFIRQLED